MRREGIASAAGDVERAKGLPVGDERNATYGFDTCRAKGADDFVLVAVNLRAPREEWLTVGDGLTGRRAVTGDGDFLFDEALVAGKIERMNLEQSRLGIQQREAGVVVVNNALQRADDASEKFG